MKSKDGDPNYSIVSLVRGPLGQRKGLVEGDAFQVLVVLDKLSGNNLFLLSAFLSHDD